MKVNRRTSFRILAAAAAGSRLAAAQTPQAAPKSADQLLQSAREELRDDAKRIAAIALPRTTEPAFLFRA